MRAMILNTPGSRLQMTDLPLPACGPNDIMLKVSACGVCRTDLHILDGELPYPKLPLVPGHEIVGTVAMKGELVENFAIGQRLGIPWLGRTCGFCHYCTDGRENLCDQAGFTGYTLNGGYAEFTVADSHYCFPVPECYSDAEAAPLLCAGLIGYRALVAAGDAKRIGIYGFGAAAHIITQLAIWQGRTIFAFTKPGDQPGQNFARELGAAWAGDSNTAPPDKMDACILFAPVGALIPQALHHTAKGGTVVCAGIHMSDVPGFPYSILWGERTIRSIANLTRRDGEEFLKIAPKAGIRPTVELFPLHQANQALDHLRNGKIHGAAVLTMQA
ncbi:zinc-dependent alcohol dehydrogenase family protein [Candidatus Nitrotoga fabula]|uniref:alcohol dehydrogenase n=1 Tax=Candidatus Nitrotoga fabula TaxID=2182327 RepID=A0A916BCT6_9PROT|nr:zinc-dependent alcohol dehydrogenase family protein [Candidatus Nitrotoga fabula]CAE6718581.1 putative alcohol dehydrogenase AdhA [Candidatus Nitrotoga fabula]